MPSVTSKKEQSHEMLDMMEYREDIHSVSSIQQQAEVPMQSVFREAPNADLTFQSSSRIPLKQRSKFTNDSDEKPKKRAASREIIEAEERTLRLLDQINLNRALITQIPSKSKVKREERSDRKASILKVASARFSSINQTSPQNRDYASATNDQFMSRYAKNKRNVSEPSQTVKNAIKKQMQEKKDLDRKVKNSMLDPSIL